MYNYFSPKYFGVGGEKLIVEGIDVEMEADGILDVAIEKETSLQVEVETSEVISIGIVVD